MDGFIHKAGDEMITCAARIMYQTKLLCYHGQAWLILSLVGVVLLRFDEYSLPCSC